MDHEEKKEPDGQEVQEPSRRRFLINAGYAVGGLVVGGAIGSLIPRRQPVQPQQPAPSGPSAGAPNNYNQALMYFTQDQFRTVEAAVERIFPADDSGPGAKDLGVAFFIDHQLAGEWGVNGREYMSPPFYVGEKVQGYQGRLNRRETFEIALREMDNYSQSKYGKNFADLTGEQQDAVLRDFESDTVPLTTISPSGFFRMLRNCTLEGAYSDPLYGGNLNMNGWRMRDYPGNQMSYANIIEKDFTKIEPSSLQAHLTAH